MLTRDDVLKQIEDDFDLLAGILVKYGAKDRIKGKDQGNPLGTEFTSDGNILYALIRYFIPQSVLEIGTHLGGSATHMSQAMWDSGEGGLIETVDINPDGWKKIQAMHLRYIVPTVANIDLYLPELIEQGIEFDFIFEDGLHSEGQVHNIYNAMHFILKSGGYIISHDTAMDGVGTYIRNGMKKGGTDMSKVRFYQVDGTPGFSMYRYEG